MLNDSFSCALAHSIRFNPWNRFYLIIKQWALPSSRREDNRWNYNLMFANRECVSSLIIYTFDLNAYGEKGYFTIVLNAWLVNNVLKTGISISEPTNKSHVHRLENRAANELKSCIGMINILTPMYVNVSSPHTGTNPVETGLSRSDANKQSNIILNRFA